MRTHARAIFLICAWALFAFGIHFASFALIPPTRGPSVRVSHAVLRVAEKVLGENYLTDYNVQGEYPSGSLHASAQGQEILLAFWLLVYLTIVTLVYIVFAWMGRSRAPHE